MRVLTGPACPGRTVRAPEAMVSAGLRTSSAGRQRECRHLNHYRRLKNLCRLQSNPELVLQMRAWNSFPGGRFIRGREDAHQSRRALRP